MIQTGACDLFIVHAWRYHPDWRRMVDLLNAHGVRRWRNFSLPWYDPALDPRTLEGGKIVRWNLESQIIPVHAVLCLAGVWREPGTRKWLDFELDMANKHRKPVLAVPEWQAGSVSNQNEIPEDLIPRVDAVVGWDAATIFQTIRCHKPDAQARENPAIPC
jgi:hypothetical protein